MLYISSALILFFLIRSAGYAVYTFKDKNIIGGISVLFLSMGILVLFIASILNILK